MSQPTVYASFTKKGDHVFRDSTYIQWGESSRSIGACLLLNPGSAELGTETSKSLEENKYASGQVKLDPTMRQLIVFIERIYPMKRPLSGRFHIYNLFNLRNAKDTDAIDAFESLVHAGEIDMNDSLISEQELLSHPWILVGWGVSQKKKWKNIERVKRNWKELIDKTGIPLIGIKHDKHDNYYHPSPNNPNKQATLEKLVEIYNNIFNIEQGSDL